MTRLQQTVVDIRLPERDAIRVIFRQPELLKGEPVVDVDIEDGPARFRPVALFYPGAVTVEHER